MGCSSLSARDFAILWYAYNSIHRCTNVMVHMPENSSWLCLNSLPQHEFPARFCTAFLHPLLRHRSILSMALTSMISQRFSPFAQTTTFRYPLPCSSFNSNSRFKWSTLKQLYIIAIWNQNVPKVKIILSDKHLQSHRIFISDSRKSW